MVHLSCMYVQRAFENESKAADRLRMDGRSVVPSAGFLRFMNVADQSDSLVLFMRALSAFHVLTHSQDFEMSLMAQFNENEEERSVASVQWPLCCCVTAFWFCLHLPACMMPCKSVAWHLHVQAAVLACHSTVLMSSRPSLLYPYCFGTCCHTHLTQTPQHTPNTTLHSSLPI